jgi:hypothetical protein
MKISRRKEFGKKYGPKTSGLRYPHSYGWYPKERFYHGTIYASVAMRDHPYVSYVIRKKKPMNTSLVVSPLK